jgi:two-component system NtrC family response regulator
MPLPLQVKLLFGMLANAFLRRNCRQYRRKLRFSGQALSAITQHHWPGNIRELENAVHRASIMARGPFIEPVDLGIPHSGPAEHLSLREARNRAERQVVVDALTRTRGNITRAATELGVSRPTLHGLLEKHGIDSREMRPAGMAHPGPLGPLSGRPRTVQQHDGHVSSLTPQHRTHL